MTERSLHWEPRLAESIMVTAVLEAFCAADGEEMEDAVLLLRSM